MTKHELVLEAIDTGYYYDFLALRTVKDQFITKPVYAAVYGVTWADAAYYGRYAGENQDG